MAFEVVSFTDLNQHHFYYFVDRFTISTNLHLYDALFKLPTDDEAMPVVLDVPEGFELFRFKVNVRDYGTFMFFFEKNDFIKGKDKLFDKVRKLKDIENNDELKVGTLLKTVSKAHPVLVAFCDERDIEFDFAEFRKPFLREHIYCKVFAFRKIDLDQERLLIKKSQKNEYIEALKKAGETAKKAGHGIKVAALATGRFLKKVGHFVKKCSIGIAKATKWTYRKVLTPIGHFITKASKFIWKYICVPVGKFFAKLGIWIWIGLKFIGRQIKRFFLFVGRGISKVSPKLLPFLGKVFRKIGHGIKIAAIYIWKGIKKFGIFIGRFFKAFGITAWKCLKAFGKGLWVVIKFIAKYLWIFIKWIGKWLKVFFIWLGKKLKQLFILIGKGFKNLPKYLEWKSDYTFYVIFSLLFAFALMCGISWSLNGDALSVFFFVMTALFMLICVYATYIQRHDHKDWKITAKNTVSPNLAIFLGLTIGVISSYFTAKAIVKVPEGKTVDFNLALWITIGVSAFLLIALNFTPFIIHKVKTNSDQKESKKVPAKNEEKPEIAGKNSIENDEQKE